MSVVRWMWWRRRELVCREAVELMTAYLDEWLCQEPAPDAGPGLRRRSPDREAAVEDAVTTG